MKAYQARYPVHTMSRVLKVSASGFYVAGDNYDGHLATTILARSGSGRW